MDTTQQEKWQKYQKEKKGRNWKRAAILWGNILLSILTAGSWLLVLGVIAIFILPDKLVPRTIEEELDPDNHNPLAGY